MYPIFAISLDPMPWEREENIIILIFLQWRTKAFIFKKIIVMGLLVYCGSGPIMQKWS